MLVCRHSHHRLPALHSSRPVVVRWRMGILLHGHAIHSNCRSLHACPESRYSSILPLSCSFQLSPLHIQANLSRLSRIAAYYLLAIAFYAVIWCGSPYSVFPLMYWDFLASPGLPACPSSFRSFALTRARIAVDASVTLPAYSSSSAPFSFLSFFGSANQNQCGKTDLAHNAISANRSQYAN